MLKMVMALFLINFCHLTFAQEAQVNGRCVGKESLGLEFRIKNEDFCVAFDDNISGCAQHPDRCSFWPDKKSCIAKNRESSADMLTCTSIWKVADCEKNSSCKWNYPYKSCNTKNQDKSLDKDFCENFDDNKIECRKQAKCAWGNL